MMTFLGGFLSTACSIRQKKMSLHHTFLYHDGLLKKPWAKHSGFKVNGHKFSTPKVDSIR